MNRKELKQSRINKRKRNRKLLFRLALIVLFIFAAIRFCFQQPILNHYAKQIKDLNEQIAQEEKKAEQIEDLKQLYESDEFKERIARERLGLVRPGERVFIDISGQ